MNLKDCWKPLLFIIEVAEPPLKDCGRDIRKDGKRRGRDGNDINLVLMYKILKDK